MTREFADAFAAEWIEAWNAHDLGRILSHYEDDFEMSSPMIKLFTHSENGTLRGKIAVGEYWKAALARAPELHFELEETLVGADSLTLIDQGVRGLSAEVFHFAESGKVSRAFAHYLAAGTSLRSDE